MTIANLTNVEIAIDRGGTFTDVIYKYREHDVENEETFKLLSVDPANYNDANIEGIRSCLLYTSRCV